MLSLHDLQLSFANAVFEGHDARLLACCAGEPTRAAQALQVYRQGTLANLMGAVIGSFPLTGRIMGEALLRTAAQRYAFTQPSLRGDLNHYGQTFPDFLADFEPVAEWPYVRDIARLEWAVAQVERAADAHEPDLSLLVASRPEAWGSLCFELTPAHAVLESDWPLYDIWRVNQPAYEGLRQVDFSQRQGALIHRGDAGVVVHALTVAEAVFVTVMGGGQCLEQAVSAVPESETWDLQALLSLLINARLLLRAYPMDTP